MKIAFIVTSIGISGGHNIIFEHAYHLAKSGHKIDIFGRNIGQFKYAYGWHDRAPYLNFCSLESYDEESRYDVAVATNFESVFHLPRIAAERYIFFMQARETDFRTAGNDELGSWLASVLNFKLPVIVSANWMKRLLSEQNGCQAHVCLSGMRKDLFSPYGVKEKSACGNGLRILVEGPLGVPHKNVDNALELCASSRASEVWLLTSTPEVKNVPSGVRVLSSVAIRDLGSIYRSCDVILKLSTSEGMAGPPLEMCHCGGTVISYDVSGHEEYLLHGVNSLVVPMGEKGLALRAINRLCESPALMEHLKRGALETAERWPSWDIASKVFEECLIRTSENVSIDREQLSRNIQHSTRKYLRESWERRKSHRHGLSSNVNPDT